MLQVHELGYADCPKAIVFRGDKEVPSQQVILLDVLTLVKICQ